MDVALSIQELADETGVSVRTIRYYIAEGLLPSAGARGRSATYGDEHLLRLRLIRRLVEQRRPLAEIRGKLANLSLAELRALACEEEKRSERLRSTEDTLSPREYIAALLREKSPEPVRYSSRASSPPDFESSTSSERPARSAEVWERWDLAPGVELHVRADMKRISRDLVRRILREAHQDSGREDDDHPAAF